ncbi:MAG: GNAT family N-acetyltransferase [Lachnospiraceae bacterium]
MNLIFKKAVPEDIDILTETRMEVLRTVYHIGPDQDLSEVEKNSYDYYKDSFQTGGHIAYLVMDQWDGREQFAAVGGVSFFQVMPTCANPDGRKAYIMNMYTRPEYRRQGIAGKVLELLIEEAVQRDITFITLDASDMGRPVYEKHGFVQMPDEMKLIRDFAAE